jgi:hypothetical protein
MVGVAIGMRISRLDRTTATLQAERARVYQQAMHTRCTTVAVTHQIRSDDCECCCDDKVVMAVSRLPTELASRSGLKTN